MDNVRIILVLPEEAAQMLENLAGSPVAQNAWIETAIRGEHAKRFGHATEIKHSVLHAQRMTPGSLRRAAIAKAIKHQELEQGAKNE